MPPIMAFLSGSLMKSQWVRKASIDWRCVIDFFTTGKSDPQHIFVLISNFIAPPSTVYLEAIRPSMPRKLLRITYGAKGAAAINK